jgi:hemerythrin-like domain-containing protein
VSLAIVDDATRALASDRAAVKRHPALAAFSADHDEELARAGALLRAADGGPEERVEAAHAYVDAFFGETVDHFRREEEVLFPVYSRFAGRRDTLERILREHMELHGLARSLRAHVAGGDVSPEELRSLGALLQDHVRLEEGQLFADIERVVPVTELEHLRP